MNKLLVTAAAAVLLVATPALAHKKKQEQVQCQYNEIYDVETNACLPILNDNDSFSETDTVADFDPGPELDWPGKSDNHRQDIGRAQRTGNNGRGTGDALDGGNPPGKGNFRNDPN